jgi:chromate transport protein ChrA
LRLGFTAFGGPAAHIAIVENEAVRRRPWLSSERFLDLLGASNLIPGPSSTELAIFIGYEQAGWRGLLVGGSCFILPAALMVTVLAWAYVRFGALPEIAGALYGIKPVVIAIVLQALWGLAPKAIKKSFWLGALSVLACAAFALGVDALLVLLGGGVGSVVVRGFANKAGVARSLHATAPRSGRRRRTGGPGVGRPGHALHDIPEDGSGGLRQRLRAPRLPACRSGRSAALAPAACRRRERCDPHRLAFEALGSSAGATLVDAILMASAAQRGNAVYTSDFNDLSKLKAHFREVRIFAF